MNDVELKVGTNVNVDASSCGQDMSSMNAWAIGRRLGEVIKTIVRCEKIRRVRPKRVPHDCVCVSECVRVRAHAS